MGSISDLASIGDRVGDIDVRLSYKIVELFSEGLYASPNKAIEELVANSFDSGAQKVAIFLPADLHAQGSTIAVLDDGEGMDATGLRRLWLIGVSNKRAPLFAPPKGRPQIGKFGIGKLATYVLAARLTHICKKDGKFYSTSMDFDKIDKRVDDGVEPKAPIKIGLRELTEEQAKDALVAWTDSIAFKECGIRLFGKGAASSWTFAILSNLKDKVHEIRPGMLEWVLRTALPLRDDFSIHLNGAKLESSKAGKGLIKKWILGKDIKELPRPASDKIEVREDTNEQLNSEKRYGLYKEGLGRITGYAEAYKELLTGKSDEVGRSHGFFVYVYGRLISVNDGHFGIKPDELRHGTFGRIRVVVHIDSLDAFLQSDREHIREGSTLDDAQDLLRGIFNYVRPLIEEHDAAEEPGARLARKLATSPAGLTRRPIVEMAQAVLAGKIKSCYIALPAATTERERNDIIETLEARTATPEHFVEGILFLYDATSSDRIAVYEATTGKLIFNGLHPFVGAFYDGFVSKTEGLPLEIFAMAEILLESQLFQSGFEQEQIDDVMTARDEMLRYVAQESGPRTPLAVANALREARNNEDKLETMVVESFNSLGFEATWTGINRSKPDGIAKAHLSPGDDKHPRSYAVTLEAKSKKKDGTTVKTQTVDIAGVIRHRDEAFCEHALVIAPAFDHTAGNLSALAKEIKADRDVTIAAKKPRTITAIHLEDLARLVQLRPIKQIGLARIREMLQKCSLPEDCKKWIDEVEKATVPKPPYAEIIHAIERLQKEARNEPIGYGELRNELKHAVPPILYQDVGELVELCKGMAQMAPGAMMATRKRVELDQSPKNVLEAIETATRSHHTEPTKTPDARHG